MGMKRRAARDQWDDDPSLTRTPTLWGTIVILDLDRFGDYVQEHGLDPYKPNDVTATLTVLVEGLARKRGGFIVYGLDHERGTEEAVIEFPLVEPEELQNDLEHIIEEVKKLGASITIAAVKAPVTGRPARDRREAYSGPRRSVKRLLEKAKRRGGGMLILA